MTASLNRLDSKRKDLYKKLEELGDFRRGTISVNYRKCGKHNCVCAKPEHVGSIMLEEIINSDNGDYRGRTIPCKNGHVFEFKEYRTKELQTVLGSVAVKRSYYYDQQCQSGYCPKDADLDIVETSFSPGIRRIMWDERWKYFIKKKLIGHSLSCAGALLEGCQENTWV